MKRPGPKYSKTRKQVLKALNKHGRKDLAAKELGFSYQWMLQLIDIYRIKKKAVFYVE